MKWSRRTWRKRYIFSRINIYVRKYLSLIFIIAVQNTVAGVWEDFCKTSHGESFIRLHMTLQRFVSLICGHQLHRECLFDLCKLQRGATADQVPSLTKLKQFQLCLHYFQFICPICGDEIECFMMLPDIVPLGMKGMVSFSDKYFLTNNLFS